MHKDTMAKIVDGVSISLPLLFSKEIENLFKKHEISNDIYFYVFRMLNTYDYLIRHKSSYFSYYPDERNIGYCGKYVFNALNKICIKMCPHTIIKALYVLASALEDGYALNQGYLMQDYDWSLNLIDNSLNNSLHSGFLLPYSIDSLNKFLVDKKTLDNFLSTLNTLGKNYNAWFIWYKYKTGHASSFIYPDAFIKDFSYDNISDVNHKIKLYFEYYHEIPKEILKTKDKVMIDDYLYSLPFVEKKLNIVRAIFMGNGGSGKTSLIRTLHGESVVEGKEKMTPGIAIREWLVPNTEITAKFWDFGGQVMTHATHQFFLRERCLYILVIDARSEIKANDQAEYWLEHIKAFGDNALVMIVGNKSDQAMVNLDMNSLTEKYNNIVGFYPLSCTEYKSRGVHRQRYEIFKQDLAEQLQKVGTHQVYFTNEQFIVLEVLREESSKSSFLPKQEFITLCDNNNIGKIGLKRDDYLALLDSLGEVIHFPNMPLLDAYVLNPRWLTYGVYTLLYSDKVTENKGRISELDVVSILSKTILEDEYGNKLEYPTEKCAFIIDAMEEFKLCYRLPQDRKQFVIPDKLLTEQPTLEFDKKLNGTLAFEFDFRSLLPRHIMPTLIVSRHEEIKDDKVWQNGVVLYSDEYNATARVQVDYYKRVLNIWVQGESAKEYLSVLHDELIMILKRMKELEYKEMVILPKSALVDGVNVANAKEDKISYKMLLSMAKNRDEFCYSELGIRYNLEKVLGEIMSKKKQEQISNTQIFNAPIGAVGGLGNNHEVEGKVIINSNDKEKISELSDTVELMKKKVMEYEAEIDIKMKAYDELQEIKKLLENIDSINPEERGKLKGFLNKIKDGSSKTMELATSVKDNTETIQWLVEKATYIAGLGLLG